MFESLWRSEWCLVGIVKIALCDARLSEVLGVGRDWLGGYLVFCLQLSELVQQGLLLCCYCLALCVKLSMRVPIDLFLHPVNPEIRCLSFSHCLGFLHRLGHASLLSLAQCVQVLSLLRLDCLPVELSQCSRQQDNLVAILEHFSHWVAQKLQIREVVHCHQQRGNVLLNIRDFVICQVEGLKRLQIIKRLRLNEVHVGHVQQSKCSGNRGQRILVKSERLVGLLISDVKLGQ
jgi:hypothetical protein